MFILYNLVNDLEHLDGFASGPLGDHAISLLDPIDYPVTFVGHFMHWRPVKYVVRILLFPVTAFLRIMRILLTPLRFLLFPIHVLYYAFLFLTTPLRYFGRIVLNTLLILPIISFPTRLLIAAYHVFTFPSAAIASTVKYLLGPSWSGYFRDFLYYDF